ncbi:hypothetical protein HDU93_002756 [Gonapodya sp. JEL0774]|nr:hypothetical protein HDU93_002756 [Gonapodya sp. JEL0774]
MRTVIGPPTSQQHTIQVESVPMLLPELSSGSSGVDDGHGEASAGDQVHDFSALGEERANRPEGYVEEDEEELDESGTPSQRVLDFVGHRRGEAERDGEEDEYEEGNDGHGPVGVAGVGNGDERSDDDDDDESFTDVVESRQDGHESDSNDGNGDGTQHPVNLVIGLSQSQKEVDALGIGNVEGQHFDEAELRVETKKEMEALAVVVGDCSCRIVSHRTSVTARSCTLPRASPQCDESMMSGRLLGLAPPSALQTYASNGHEHQHNAQQALLSPAPTGGKLHLHLCNTQPDNSSTQGTPGKALQAPVSMAMLSSPTQEHPTQRQNPRNQEGSSGASAKCQASFVPAPLPRLSTVKAHVGSPSRPEKRPREVSSVGTHSELVARNIRAESLEGRNAQLDEGERRYPTVGKRRRKMVIQDTQEGEEEKGVDFGGAAGMECAEVTAAGNMGPPKRDKGNDKGDILPMEIDEVDFTRIPVPPNLKPISPPTRNSSISKFVSRPSSPRRRSFGLSQHERSPQVKQCGACGTRLTTMWRRGPDGPGTLCASCGSYFARKGTLDGWEDARREGSNSRRSVAMIAMDLSPPGRGMSEGMPQAVATMNPIGVQMLASSTHENLSIAFEEGQMVWGRKDDPGNNAGELLGAGWVEKRRCGTQYDVQFAGGHTEILDAELPPNTSVLSLRKIGRSIVLQEASVISSTDDDATIAWRDGENTVETRAWTHLLVARQVVEVLNANAPRVTETVRRGDAAVPGSCDMHSKGAIDQMLANYAFVFTLPVDTGGRTCERCDPKGDPLVISKREMTRIILERGGKVFDSFSECFRARERLTKRTVLLLATRPLRTVKYLLALALGVPTVSIGFVVQGSGLRSKFVPSFEWILEGVGRLCQVGAFRAKAYVHSISAAWRSTWESVMIAAGAIIVTVTPTTAFCDLIVTDRPVSTVTLQSLFRSRKCNPIIVSSEYVLQCVIAQRRLAVESHPSYKRNP